MEDAAKRLDALERVLADMIVKQGMLNRQLALLMQEVKRIEEESRKMPALVSHLK